MCQLGKKIMSWEKISLNLANKILGRQNSLYVTMNCTLPTLTVTAETANGSELFKIRFPYSTSFEPDSKSLCNTPIFNLVLILIKSGIATIGFFENGSLSSHKVFRAYMVRKKQGKSQVKYLKTKGKSRAGSRVRLQETNEFFESINSRLQELAKHHPIDKIAISCSKTLLPYFFNSKTKPPFEMHDPRIFRVPIHVPNATHEVLLKAHGHLSSCRILVGREFEKDFLDLKQSDMVDGTIEGDDW